MDGFYRMTDLEVAFGWVPGYEPVEDDSDNDPDRPADHPLVALEKVLLPALESSPCYIEFSGGRDSSAILGVAVDVARRHGLEPPVPMTRHYPGAEQSHEDVWQETVVRHLGLTEWVRLDYRDEFDLLGPTARDSLFRLGMLWPPTVHTRSLVWEVAKGATVVSGEGGDEIFGMRRLSPLAGLLAGNVHPRRAALRAAAAELWPRRIGGSSSRRDGASRAWLRPKALRRYARCSAQDRAGEPIRWDRATQRLGRRRADRLGLHNLRLSARQSGASYLVPLHDQAVLSSLAAAGGAMGFPGRSAAMRTLFGHLLPESILNRSSKATFTAVYFNRYSRRFVEAWDGAGVDQQLVDITVLREEWSKPSPHAGTHALLQAAWLASKSESIR